MPLPTCSAYEDFRSLRHKLGWVGYSRQLIVAPVKILSQVTEKRFNVEHIRHINSLVKRVKSAGEQGLMQHKFDIERLKIVANTDSSFANNYD